MSAFITERELRNLLGRTQDLIQQNEKLIRARKESFNLFSILNVERREENTHSAFIAELLKSDGSHLLGNTFLKLFLSTIDPLRLEVDFNVDNYEVIVEKNIGNIDIQMATGGRIDIYLQDKITGKSISIENKIDAGDQPQQLKRYHNYNLANNTVIYLTLNGSEASKESCVDLKVTADYHCISYRYHIINWLELCLKEASDHPILRESIKQYLILTKKLTNTLEMEGQEGLKRLLIENLKEAEYIAENLYVLKKNFRKEIKDKIQSQLEKILKEFKFHQGAPISHNVSQLWLAPKNNPENGLWFGIESFGVSGHLEGKLFVGINDWGATVPGLILNGDNELNDHNWKLSKFLEYEGQSIVLNNSDFIANLYKENKTENFVQDIVQQILQFIEQHINQLNEQNEK